MLPTCHADDVPVQSLPAMAKALLLRLLLRKRTWFQLGSLAYADVPQPEAAARRLAAVSLLQVSAGHQEWHSPERVQACKMAHAGLCGAHGCKASMSSGGTSCHFISSKAARR